MPRTLSDSPAHALHDYNGQKVDYKEGIFVGYRWYDHKNIEPLFPFGFGLSYTTFKYSDISVEQSRSMTTVSFTVTNTGDRAGAEVAQLYVKDSECSVPRPPKELKGFTKVFLNKGESKTVTLKLDKAAFSFWHPDTNKWTLEPGEFEIMVGSSSRDIKLKKIVKK